MLDKFKDECGVFGIFGNPEAANLTYLGFYALQHRGQESAVSSRPMAPYARVRAMGHVADAFDERSFELCPGISRSVTRATRPPVRAGSTTPSLS